MFIENSNEKTRWILSIVFVGFMGLVALFMIAPDSFFAVDETAAGTMFKVILKIINLIVLIIGVILAIVGVAKFAISHAEGGGAEQHKAILMMATGAVLVVLPIILNSFSDTLVNLITGGVTDSEGVN